MGLVADSLERKEDYYGECIALYWRGFYCARVQIISGGSEANWQMA